jgi:hypothetical protein
MTSDAIRTIEELLQLRADNTRLKDEVTFLRAALMEAIRPVELPRYSEQEEALRRYMGAA